MTAHFLFCGEATSSPRPTRQKLRLWTHRFAVSPLAGQADISRPRRRRAPLRNPRAVIPRDRRRAREPPSLDLLSLRATPCRPPIPIARPLPSPRGLRFSRQAFWPLRCKPSYQKFLSWKHLQTSHGSTRSELNPHSPCVGFHGLQYQFMQKDLLFFLLAVCSVCSSCSTGQISVQGERLRTTGAYKRSLGDVGSLRVNLLRPDAFEGRNESVARSANTNLFRLRTVVVRESDRQRLSKAQAKAGTNYSASGTHVTHSIDNGKFHLFSAVPQELVAELNKPRNRALRERLAKDPYARIVSALAFVYDHRFERFATNKFELSASGVRPIAATAGTEGESRVIETFSDKTAFAYQLSSLCWEATDDGSLRVADIWLDNPGLSKDQRCPAGTLDQKRMVELRSAPDFPKLTNALRIHPSHFLDETSFELRPSGGVITNLQHRANSHYKVPLDDPSQFRFALYFFVEGFKVNTRGTVDLEVTENIEIGEAGSRKTLGPPRKVLPTTTVDAWKKKPTFQAVGVDRFREFSQLDDLGSPEEIMPFLLVFYDFKPNEIPDGPAIVRITVRDQLANCSSEYESTFYVERIKK